MTDEFSRLREVLNARPTPKQPLTSPGQLSKWVLAARKELNQTADVQIDEGRLGWLVASAVVVSVLQRARTTEEEALFLLKGGSYLQYRLGLGTRATTDVDGLVRGDIDDFLEGVDALLREPWGGLALSRTEFEFINVPGKVNKPRRFNVKLQVRGASWRSIQVEVSPDEAGAGEEHDNLLGLPLHGFGLPDADQLFGIAIRYQIAQKLHAVTDPHDPPDFINERARDLVDLVLLRRTVEGEGLLSRATIRDACVRVFEARAAEAIAANRLPRAWPPTVVGHPSWRSDYRSAADRTSVSHSFDEALAVINEWIRDLEG